LPLVPLHHIPQLRPARKGRHSLGREAWRALRCWMDYGHGWVCEADLWRRVEGTVTGWRSPPVQGGEAGGLVRRDPPFGRQTLLPATVVQEAPWSARLPRSGSCFWRRARPRPAPWRPRPTLGGRAARPAACRTKGAAHNRQETPRGSLAVVWRSPVRVGAPTVWVTTQAGACRAGLASQRDRGGEQKSCMGEPWGNAGTRDGPGKIWGDSGVPLGGVPIILLYGSSLSWLLIV